MILPLALAYLLAGRITPMMRIVLGYTALVILGGIAVTFSRGGWMACVVTLLALLGIFIGNRHHRLPALVLAVVLLGGGGIFFAKYLTHTGSYMQRMGRVLDNQSAAVDYLDMRRDLWIVAIQMWRDNFWWGAGPAHFNYRYPVYRPARIQMQPDRAHNDYLNLLADWGTIGGIITLTGIAVFGAGLWRTRNHVRRMEKEFRSGHSNRFAFFVGAAAGACSRWRFIPWLISTCTFPPTRSLESRCLRC